MKVDIWFSNDDSFTHVHTLDIFSVSDESTCELAFFHTQDGSPTQLRSPEIRGMTLGDVVVIEGHRAYELTSLADCSRPKFTSIDIETLNLVKG